jgi:outer membrane protein assembly factor BamB
MTRRFVFAAIICFTCVISAIAQRGGQEWLTSNGDAQRSSWMRSDTKISVENMRKPGFQFLWKLKLDNETKQLNSLTQPILVGNIIGYRGFKSMALVGGSSDTLYAIDDDLGRIYWKTRLSTATSTQSGSLLCPGGLTAGATRPVTVNPFAPGRGGGAGNRANAARSLVGQPDEGFPDVFGRGAAPAATPAPARGAAPAPEPPRGGGGGGGNVNAFQANASVFVLAADGMVHQLSLQTGKDMVTQPVRFVPPNSNAGNLILVDGFLYTWTINDCGGTPNGVWAIDLAGENKSVTSWKLNGGNIAGSSGPTLGTDGTIYVAIGDASGATYANSVAALEPKTLKLHDYFTQLKADFSASPLVFQHKGKDLIVVAGKDGRLYILDSTSLGGTDHHNALSSTAVGVGGTDFGPTALASFEDADGTRWVLVPTATSVAAFKVVERNGIPSLQQGWVSREMVSPLPPIIINNVIFALSSGEYRASGQSMTAAQRAQRSKPAVLYALEASTGKELWNSGTTMTSFVHSAGLSGGAGQVYVGTYDNTFYTFGFPIEK